MNVRLEERPTEVIAWLTGELDHHAAEFVRRELDTALDMRRGCRLVLDMSGLSFMDSSGIGVILGRYKKVKAAGGRLAVRGVNEKMDRILRLAGLYQVVEREGGRKA